MGLFCFDSFGDLIQTFSQVGDIIEKNLALALLEEALAGCIAPPKNFPQLQMG